MKTVAIVILTLTLALSAVALAGNNPQAKAAVHVRPHDPKLGCDYGTVETCGDLEVTEPGYNIDAFPVFFDLNEFQGCEYGMFWPDWTYSAAFTNCADLVIGSIARPGDGASHTWFDCWSDTWVCVPCFIWLYADGPGMICVVAHPVSGVIHVLDCAEGVDEPFDTFCAGVYGFVGDDPCPPVGAPENTWSGLKGIFK